MTFTSVIFDNNYQEEYSEITSLKHCRFIVEITHSITSSVVTDHDRVVVS